MGPLSSRPAHMEGEKATWRDIAPDECLYKGIPSSCNTPHSLQPVALLKMTRAPECPGTAVGDVSMRASCSALKKCAGAYGSSGDLLRKIKLRTRRAQERRSEAGPREPQTPYDGSRPRHQSRDQSPHARSKQARVSSRKLRMANRRRAGDLQQESSAGGTHRRTPHAFLRIHPIRAIAIYRITQF